MNVATLKRRANIYGALFLLSLVLAVVAFAAIVYDMLVADVETLLGSLGFGLIVVAGGLSMHFDRELARARLKLTIALEQLERSRPPAHPNCRCMIDVDEK